MQGYQFAHMETYSVKGAPGAGPDATAKKKNGQKAWTAQEIMEEAERKRLASLHVGKGGPPPEIMGGEVSSFDALRDAHAAAAARKESFRYTKKDGTVQTRRRRLRADAPTLHTTIVSLPVTSMDALANPALLEKCRGLLRKAMEDEGSTRIAGQRHEEIVSQDVSTRCNLSQGAPTGDAFCCTTRGGCGTSVLAIVLVQRVFDGFRAKGMFAS